ncbi:PREDICTED: LOW QUALITY PROTEIN: nuclear pore complex protein Nup205-like [Priapulus caudatus]|uniref:LOW QUALITY PROTEIN: nuclear pore complex protein Nup205-like n=1 Tax=Priapulus caudatus TaxID=37621 RepID=A0ABM1DXF2_PRICU|nr:PREDICTED: LOW QUALITY PROTEIN: nuclear pore complex protein Nup205-like [Priapulus caudatus]
MALHVKMAASNSAVNLGARLWTPYKDLNSIVENAILLKRPYVIHDLEVALRRHKPDFLSLLQNPTKNPAHREMVKNAAKEGLPIEGQKGSQLLSSHLIEEALIISDLFNLNEIAAVELLLAGETQLSSFPGLNRGLVAVLLYYDGRSSLVGALKALIQSREGKTWTLELGAELVTMTVRYTDQLMEEGLTGKILGLLSSLDLTKEINKLHEDRGLGSPRHRKQVLDLMKEIRQQLADCLLWWSCGQTPLDKHNTLQLLSHMKKDKCLSADGSLESSTLALLMAFLYCIDVSVLEQAEDTEGVLEKLPILADAGFVPALHKEILAEYRWECTELKTIVQFAWGVTLRVLSQHPASQGLNEFLEEDENVVNNVIDNGVFLMLNKLLVSVPGFHQEEMYMRRMHTLVTDFISLMPLKMAALYSTDPLGLHLTLDYWYPTDAITGGVPASSNIYQRPPQRQASLFKFVRMAGDLLPPSLYIPYIEMLTSLATDQASAQHCFNLLKSNGVNAGGQYSTISWDHFFHSITQYYSNLRQETPASSYQHLYWQKPHSRGITPQELEGLHSVLKLIRKVSEEDEVARLSLCENQQYLPIVLLLGMVTCSVPASLKGEFLDVLAAFARSPEVAINLWQSLEVSSILQTVKPMSVSATNTGSGIQADVDEVEARNEEFPMTRGFLALLDSLTNIPVPEGLGAGYRAPGFDPYMTFIRDTVFLKFNTRAYKNPAEKWDIAAMCLDMFYKLLRGHEVVLEDFSDEHVELQGGGVTVANKPPGHNILIHMLSDGALLRMVFFIIDEGVRLLDEYRDFAGKSSLERCALLCLRLLQATLERQGEFLDALRESGVALMVTPLERLLAGINVRTGRADNLVSITKYVTYSSWIPAHALASINILNLVAQATGSSSELVGLMMDMTVELRHGFVECLEIDDCEDNTWLIRTPTAAELSESHIRNLTRQSALRLILLTLEHPAPNLAHLLLGYELRKPVSSSILQDPGVLGSPRTCLHAMLALLDRGLGPNAPPGCLYDTPVLAELAYSLIYALCSNKDTWNPTLRYLRSANDFLYTQLQSLPFKGEQYLCHQSWLLKCIAIELRVTAANRQTSYVQRMVSLLLDDAPTTLQKGVRPEGVLDSDTLLYESDTTLFPFATSRSGPSITSDQLKRKILSILDSISFKQKYPDPLRLEYFDQQIIEQVIASCEQRSLKGVKYCDVKRLHHILQDELNQIQGSAAIGQRTVITKVLDDESVTELTSPAAGVILILLANLRHSFLATQAEDVTVIDSSQYVSVLDDSSGSQQTATPSSGLLAQHGATLQVVLKGLIDSILKTGGVYQRVRANLYGALLSYLRIAHRVTEVPIFEGSGLKMEVRPRRRNQTEVENLASDNVGVILSYGEGLMEVVSRDSCDGHDVGKMLAFATLDAVIATDKADHWMAFLGKKGYLRHYVDSLLQDNGKLQESLSPVPEPLRALYLYESKMGLLTRIAQSPSGAQMLLQCGIMGRLAECTVFSMRPQQEYSLPRTQIGGLQYESFLPTVMDRYRQILQPALKLCLAILMSLGSRNKQAANEVLGFLVAHSEMVSSVLRDAPTSLDLASLQELALVTAVVARSAVEDPDDEAAMAADRSAFEAQSHVSRIQRQMLALLSRYSMTESLRSHINSIEELQEREGRGGGGGGPGRGDVKAMMRLSVLQVAANVLSYCRSLVSQSGTSAKFCRILFAPNLKEALVRESSGKQDFSAI